MGMNILMKWYRYLRAGHSGVLNSLHVLGDKTSVSHAATVKVHTKKYLCADRCGGKSKEGGSWRADIVGSS
jgi:hypothetical protein